MKQQQNVARLHFLTWISPQAMVAQCKAGCLVLPHDLMSSKGKNNRWDLLRENKETATESDSWRILTNIVYQSSKDYLWERKVWDFGKINWQQFDLDAMFLRKDDCKLREWIWGNPVSMVMKFGCKKSVCLSVTGDSALFRVLNIGRYNARKQFNNRPVASIHKRAMHYN